MKFNYQPEIAPLDMDSDEDKKKKKYLQHIMNLISERRLKFSTYLAGFVAGDNLNHIDQAIAEAYLSGIDDCNRIVKFLMGEGPDITQPDFFKKAAIHKPSNYGMDNLSEAERKALTDDKDYAQATRQSYQTAIVESEKSEQKALES